ncbi:MAG: glycosyltransferase [Bacteroides sp.]|nr:glycosyltransferase [Bacteroides sp.]
MKEKTRICWITASYFLDVDLPVVPSLMDDFIIDWTVITTPGQLRSDSDYIRSQTGRNVNVVTAPARFYSPALFTFFRSLVRRIAEARYDLYYLDISDLLFLFPLVKKYLPADRVIVATHNVSVPKGARLAPLAKMTMRYILSRFRHFQVFSKSQLEVLKSRRPDADVFYCPLMLKDYGPLPADVKKEPGIRTFLFFGKIIRYKRLDILLRAVNLLADRGVGGFRVEICGYCGAHTWQKEYQPLIEHPDLVSTDIRRIPNEEVARCFAKSDFFVMPYQDIAQSGALTVALNYNLPVIASDLPAFKEFLTPGVDSMFFASGDAAALADAMQKAIEMPAGEYMAMERSLADMVSDRLSHVAIISSYRNYLNSL